MDHPDVLDDRRRRPRPEPSAWGDFLYDAFYGGALGGSAVALVSLVIDIFRFEPLFTPSLLGSALFLGTDPAAVTEVHLDLVALFTIVHLAAFAAVGLLISALVQRLHDLAFHPVVVSVIVFMILHGGILVVDALVLGGVVAVIGFWWLALVNASAGITMSLFLLHAHRNSDTVYE